MAVVVIYILLLTYLTPQLKTDPSEEKHGLMTAASPGRGFLCRKEVPLLIKSA